MTRLHCTIRCLLLLLAASSCGDSDGDSDISPADAKLADDVLAKEKECKVYSGPAANPVNDTVQDDFDRCLAACFLDAPCAEIKIAACSTKADSTDFYACVETCPLSPKDGFECADGSLLPHILVCDGSQDCWNAEDEDGCDGYTCADGERLSDDEAKCDGSDDCTDGSDEVDCPNVCD